MSTTTTTPDTIHLDVTAREALASAVFLAGPGEDIARSKTAEEADRHLEAARRTVALVRAAESGELPLSSAGFALAEVADRRHEAQQEGDTETIAACEHFAAVVAEAGSFPSRPVPLTERTAELLSDPIYVTMVGDRIEEYGISLETVEGHLRDGLAVLAIVRAAEARELPASLIPRVRVLVEGEARDARGCMLDEPEHSRFIPIDRERLAACVELAEAIA